MVVPPEVDGCSVATYVSNLLYTWRPRSTALGRGRGVTKVTKLQRSYSTSRKLFNDDYYPENLWSH